MALIKPDFYTGPALIVGDGNFSFSACLAEFLGGNSPPIFATSLDSEEELQSNPVAMENLQKIAAFPTFKPIHSVDATNLDSTFQDQIFHRIIFNFPHTGGKLKISKCRSLLEKFFISAASHIESTRGVVCVSLCQGQGGTPRDAVQREYGNTWQVVEQGAKAGFILNTVHPFRESDYPGYNSAGFKGRLNQSFLTERGLTYMFILDDPIPTVPDPDSSLQIKDTPNKLFHIKDHPIEILKKKLEKCIANLPGNERFNIINDTQDMDLSDTFSNSCSISTSSNETSGASSLYTRVQQRISQGQSSFVITDIETNFSVPVSAGFHPICHTLAIVRLYSKDTLEEMESDLKRTYDYLFHEVCPGVSFTQKQQKKQSSSIDLTFKRSHMNRFKPQDYQELRQRQRNENEWRPKCQKQDEECHCRECCSVQERTGNLCKICELEDKYFFKENYQKSKHLIDDQKSYKFYGSSGLVFTCGLIASNEMSVVSDGDNDNQGWVILVHLDHLVMEVFGINDLRVLWSQEKLFLQQFLKHDKDSASLSHFNPFSLFPPIYVHDISFWLTPDSTEERFFKAIHDVTQNYVCDVWLRDRYVDQDKNRVSYGYRMLYSRCDGPLTHLQTVEIQNLLRRMLISFNFDLS